MRDYAQPRQYSGYSAGAPTPEPAQAMPGGIPASMFEGSPPPMRMDDQTFQALMQGGPVPPQPAYAPAPQRMDANALAGLMQGGQANQPISGSAPILPQGFSGGIPESTFIDNRQFDNPQGPPMPLGMALTSGVDRNALRQSIFPYMQNLGLAR